MMSAEKNQKINEALNRLYAEKTEAFLNEWKKHYGSDAVPNRINEFGIVDEEKYDAENGILFIAKETNGWDFSEGVTFLTWLKDIAIKKDFPLDGIARKHPQTWYNIARWTKLIQNPETDPNELICLKKDALPALRSIAFTNISKVGGGSTSKDAFWSLVESMREEDSVVFEILKKEIEIIVPKYIVLCGIQKDVLYCIEHSAKVIEMPHPSARTISKEAMLSMLRSQLKV